MAASVHPPPAARPCPACGGTGRLLGHKNEFPVLVCRDCRTLYAARLAPNADDFEAVWSNPDETAIPAPIIGQIRRIVAGFERRRQTNRLLDLGFGSAVFLQAATNARWQTWGVDVSRAAIAHARQLGFQELFHGDLAAAGYRAGYFDVVVAGELFEHVGDVRALLQEIHRVLRPGGLLWATTPHGRGAAARLLGLDWGVICPPGHVQLFSVAGMRRLLQAVGFRRVRLATHGLNPYELLHAWRGRPSRNRRPPGGAGAMSLPERAARSRALNEQFLRTPFRRGCKRVLNSMLSVTRLGDRLKIEAIR